MDGQEMGKVDRKEPGWTSFQLHTRANPCRVRWGVPRGQRWDRGSRGKSRVAQAGQLVSVPTGILVIICLLRSPLLRTQRD